MTIFGFPRKRMKNCIAVDWFQAHIRMPQKDFENLFCPFRPSMEKDRDSNSYRMQLVADDKLAALNEKFQLENTGLQTRHFKKIYSIIDRRSQEEIAVIAAEPRSELCMKEDSGLIKIINKYLYQKNFSHYVRSLFSDLGLQFINITRLDLAYDFLRFDTMSCTDFISRVNAGQQLAGATHGHGYIKVAKSKIKCMGDSASVEHGKMTGGYSSLKFGMETSDVCYYLYNKSLELMQMKDKPWIRDHWAANDYTEKQGDVWRFEFSLKSTTDGIAVVDADGVLQRVHHFKDLDILDHIDEVFEHYFTKHFQFVRAAKTKKGHWKKQSRCKPVVLFKNMKFEGCKIALSDKKDTSRSAKIFAKKLMQLNNELRGTDFDLAIYGNEVMTHVILQHDLEAWQKKKMPGIVLSDRIRDKVNRERHTRLMATDAEYAAIMNNKEGSPRVFKTAVQQAEDLRKSEFDLKLSKFEIIPDGKVPMYDEDGKIISYVNPVF